MEHRVDVPASAAARGAVRRLALGRVISLTGTFAAGTALNFTIYERTRSTVWLAAAMLLTWGIVGFFGPITGAIGDRFDRRRVMMVCETCAAAGWVSMAFLVDRPALLLGAAFVSSLLEAPFFPASSAAIPNVAGEEHLAWANSLISAGRYTGMTIGPMIGGILVATLGARWMFLGNAASYLVSVGLVASVHMSFADPERSAEDEEAHRGLAAGFRFINRDRVLRTMLLSFFAFILGMATTLVADPVLADDFGVGSFGYGLIVSCWGAGTIAGSWYGRRVREEDEARWIVLFSGLLALTGFGVAFSPWFWLVLVFSALFGFTDGPTGVVEQNLLQRRTPDVVRSRVMGAWDSINHAALVIAMVAGGAIVPLVGPRGAYVVGGIAGLIGTVILVPLLRWLPEPSGAAQPALTA